MFWLLFCCINNVASEVFNFEKLNFSKTTVVYWNILVTFSAIKTQEISTDWKCRLHLEKQFNIKLLSKKTGRKTFSSFRNSQNHPKILLGLFSPESPSAYVLCKIMGTVLNKKDENRKRVCWWFIKYLMT